MVSTQIQFAAYSIVGIISFITNCLIFIVIGTNKKLQTKSTFLLLSLAFTDWLITVLGIPVQLVNLLAGENTTQGKACDLFGFMILVPFIATNSNLTLIAFHRYIMVVKNKYYRTIFTKRKTVMAVLLVWITSILVSLPPLFGWGRYAYNDDRAHCMVDWKHSTKYLIFLQTLAYPIPMAVMCFCYYSVLKYTIDSRRKLQGSLDGLYRKKRELRLTIMLLVVLCCFFIFYFPYAVLIIYEGLLQKTPSHLFSFLAMFFAYVNSMVDFWIYSTMSTTFKQAVIKTLYKLVRKKPPLHTLSAYEIAMMRKDGTLDKTKNTETCITCLGWKKSSLHTSTTVTEESVTF